MSDQTTEGWAFPANSRKAHYIRDMMALCRKYGFYRGPLQPDSGKASIDDCVTCRRLFEREATRG